MDLQSEPTFRKQTPDENRKCLISKGRLQEISESARLKFDNYNCLGGTNRYDIEVCLISWLDSASKTSTGVGRGLGQVAC